MTFQEKVIRLRKLKGLTQDEFASAVGVSRQAVYKWESGKSYPEVAKLLEIKILFNISIDDLLDENYEVALPEKKKRKRLSKEEKAAIEAEVLADSSNAVSAPEQEEAPAEAVEEPVPVAVGAAEEAPIEEPATAEPEVIEQEAPAIEEPVAVAEEKSEKKVGFFGRLFGRK